MAVWKPQMKDHGAWERNSCLYVCVHPSVCVCFIKTDKVLRRGHKRIPVLIFINFSQSAVPYFKGKQMHYVSLPYIQYSMFLLTSQRMLCHWRNSYDLAFQRDEEADVWSLNTFYLNDLSIRTGGAVVSAVAPKVLGSLSYSFLTYFLTGVCIFHVRDPVGYLQRHAS